MKNLALTGTRPLFSVYSFPLDLSDRQLWPQCREHLICFQNVLLLFMKNKFIVVEKHCEPLILLFKTLMRTTIEQFPEEGRNLPAIAVEMRSARSRRNNEAIRMPSWTG